MKDRSSNSVPFRVPRAAALLFGACTVAAASQAHAATVEILREELPQEARVYGAHYEVDQRDEVRVVVEFSRPEEGPGDSAGVRFTSESFPVPELRFDRASGEIRLNTGNTSTTCAREARLLWAKWYKTTSACRLVVENLPRTTDGLSTTTAVVALATSEPERLSGPK